MKTAIHSMTFGITAVSAIATQRFVDYDGNPCAAGEKALAASHAGGAEIGEECPLALGIVLVEAGAAIAKGDDVESDANGKAITQSAGVVNGAALDAASADGDIIRVKNI
ncbi:DUF2190 family protein [Desulfobacula phenolica]|uniref:Uncharacterized conserved protein n=1 Tax=Desulfobacula phenolica TaxID=90732 RepID=A0A1H2H4S2_9BACT|nr:DUF2190 family protein [Desulfobacula phenolica]SDU26802.1 Uncharacterized conserved protein [Desulfobacula phenolica]